MITADEFPLRHADFSLSDDHELVRDMFATFFQRECTTERVRNAEPDGFDHELWKQLHEIRVVAMGVPEHLGGDGASHVDLVLLAQEWGRHLAPAPLAEALVAARLLARVAPGPTDALSAAMDGSTLVTFAHHRAFSGSPQLVTGAAVADRVVGLVGDDLVLATLKSTPPVVPNQGRLPLAWIDLAGDDVERTVLATGAAATTAFAAARRDWQLLMASALVGMAKGALAIAVDHAKDRVAFGVPIGSFQAVAHPLVDVAMNTEVAERLTFKAAWWADTEPEAERQLVPMAYLAAEEAAVHAATVGVHTLGGVGFTVESDEQLFFRRAKGWTLMAGDPQQELDTIADAMWGPVT